MQIKVLGSALLVDGNLLTRETTTLGDFKRALEEARPVLDIYVFKPSRVERIFLLHLGQREETLSGAGVKLLKSSDGDFRLFVPQHIKAMLRPYWDAIRDAGFNPVLCNGWRGGLTGYFLGT